MTDQTEYRNTGALLVPFLFEEREVEAVRQDARAVFMAQLSRHGLISSDDVPEEEFEGALFELFARHTNDFVSCGKQIQHLISLHRLGTDPRLTDLLAKLGLSFPNVNTRPVLYVNSRHLAEEEVYWRVFPHQDWRSMQGSLDAAVVWVPLMDIDKSLGAIEIVPGSHLRGLMTTEVDHGFGKVDRFSDADFVPVETRRGDALVFSAFLVHRSGTNTTDSIRWSCHFRYSNLAEATFVERGYPHPYVYRPQEELITPGFPTEEQIQRLFR